MPPRDPLPRKLTVRARGRTFFLVKRPDENGDHVNQKALLWLRYLPRCPDLRVEQAVARSSRYEPALYALDAMRQAIAFRGARRVASAEKLRAAPRAHPGCHFAFRQRHARLDLAAAPNDAALTGLRRRAPAALVGLLSEAEGCLAAAAAALRDDEFALRRCEAPAR